MSISNDELRSLVDWEHGLISPKIFIDEEIYQLELERLFGRTWLFLAHDTMIRNPGDFFATYMGGDPVIISRQKDGSVRAFLNVCRHRGMKVCRAEEGNTNNFMCTYHGWTYDGSGALVSVPNFEDAYYGELEMSKWGLVPIRVESYKGLWFGNFDETAPPLIDYLGDMAWYIDVWLDHSDDGIEVVPGVVKWTINGNWKVAAEQFAGDVYHVPVTHASSLINPEVNKGGKQFASPLGHGQGIVVLPAGGRLVDDPLSDYHEKKIEAAERRLGSVRAHTMSHFTTFPNFSGLGGSYTMGVWHPKGPNKFEIWRFTILEKNAPEEIKRAQQKSSVLTDGAAGTIEIDDGENWNLMGQLLEQGSKSRSIYWNYQMGLGHEINDDPNFPGRISPKMFCEMPQRNFYRRWLDFLTSDTWPEARPYAMDPVVTLTPS